MGKLRGVNQEELNKARAQALVREMLIDLLRIEKQLAIAAEIGTDQGTISKMLNGQTCPAAQGLLLLRKTLMDLGATDAAMKTMEGTGYLLVREQPLLEQVGGGVLEDVASLGESEAGLRTFLLRALADGVVDVPESREGLRLIERIEANLTRVRADLVMRLQERGEVDL